MCAIKISFEEIKKLLTKGVNIKKNSLAYMINMSF